MMTPSRGIVATYFRQAGIDVVEAPDGKTALAIADRQRFDLVVLDVNLPDGFGFDLAL